MYVKSLVYQSPRCSTNPRLLLLPFSPVPPLLSLISTSPLSYTHLLSRLQMVPLRGAGSAVPREGFDLSVIILASLLVFPMLGCRHSLLRL